MKLAIIGSRNLAEFDKNVILAQIPPETVGIISGGASGIDAIAAQIARELGLRLIEIKPDYQKYGKTAPIVRNAEIVKLADSVLAVWDFHSRGTAHVIASCIETGVPVRIIGPDGAPGDFDIAKALKIV